MLSHTAGKREVTVKLKVTKMTKKEAMTDRQTFSCRKSSTVWGPEAKTGLR